MNKRLCEGNGERVQDWNVISMYTRQEALRDGVLIDISELAREVGYVYPVAVTAAVWNEIISPDEKAKERCESTSGRLWDVLYVSSMAARNSYSSTSYFKVSCTKEGKSILVDLRAEIGPGDDLKPVITIMLPHED